VTRHAASRREDPVTGGLNISYAVRASSTYQGLTYYSIRSESLNT